MSQRVLSSLFVWVSDLECSVLLCNTKAGKLEPEQRDSFVIRQQCSFKSGFLFSVSVISLKEVDSKGGGPCFCSHCSSKGFSRDICWVPTKGDLRRVQGRVEGTVAYEGHMFSHLKKLDFWQHGLLVKLESSNRWKACFLQCFSGRDQQLFISFNT